MITHTISRAINKEAVSRPISWFCQEWPSILRKVTLLLQRPYPRARRAASSPSYLVLLRVGFTWPAGHPAAGGLLHHLFTLTLCTLLSIMALRLGMPYCLEFRVNKAVCFCGTFPEVTFAGRYPAPCPMEPGLSSGPAKAEPATT